MHGHCWLLVFHGDLNVVRQLGDAARERLGHLGESQQVGAEAFGLAGPDVDAELMAMGRIHDRNHPDFLLGEIEQGHYDDVSVMLYTSGTTGKPKGVCHTHTGLIVAARGCVSDNFAWELYGLATSYPWQDVAAADIPMTPELRAELDIRHVAEQHRHSSGADLDHDGLEVLARPSVAAHAHHVLGAAELDQPSARLDVAAAVGPLVIVLHETRTRDAQLGRFGDETRLDAHRQVEGIDGVEVHATILQNLVRNEWLRRGNGMLEVGDVPGL